MSRRLAIVTLVLCSPVAFLVGLSLPAVRRRRRGVERRRARAAPTIACARVGRGRARRSSSFADVAERINAAVVNIDASANTPPRRVAATDVRPGRTTG